jgi:DNA-binding LytR/AlgR family response regulator
LYIRSRSNREETADVLPTEIQTLNPEPIVFSSAPVESRVVAIESIQQYKTIYRFTPEGLSQETLRKSFDELTESSANNLLKVHKSFMVTPDLIERIERDGRNYSLILKHISKPVPISRNKLEDVRAFLL